jgi:phospholipase/carboxylesterase
MSFLMHLRQGEGRPIFGFHGTGGNETSMTPIYQAVADGRPYASPRGKSMLEGIPRYFRRFDEGILDVDDLKEKASELRDWILKTRPLLGEETPDAIGYSNGATIIGGLSFGFPGVFRRAVLLRPMVPYDMPEGLNLTGSSFLLLASREDSITPFSGAERLAELLKSAGAEARLVEVPGGHMLTQADLYHAADFLAEKANA